MTDKRDNNTPVAAITGAGAGLGRQLALGLAEQGYRVFGTRIVWPGDRRPPAGVERIGATDDRRRHRRPGGALVGGADHRSARRPWARRADQQRRHPHAWPTRVAAPPAIRHEFGVNVFGILAVINAFLPALRRARGRIVQIGSATGKFPLPFNGPSSASKAALEAFADVYRAELKPFGVHFVIVEPGNMATGGPAATAHALQKTATSMTAEQRVLYGDAFAAFSATFNSMQASGLDVNTAAARVIQVAQQQPAPIRVPIGADAEQLMKAVHERTDEELDSLRMRVAGLAT